jgi:hypothetical protein
MMLKERMMKTYFYLLSTLILLYTSSVQAWLFDEHQLLGDHAYERACSDFRESNPGLLGDQLQRLELACLKSTEGHYYAGIYGQAAAVSGDHSATPNDFFTGAAQRYVASTREYALLALRNSSHFHPLVTKEWRDHFNQAIEESLNSQGESGAQLLDSFERILYTHAFSSHFYQDAFSAGHMAYNRVGSTSAPAMTFHDHWNDIGRWVTDGHGDTWLTMGDGCLRKSEQCKLKTANDYDTAMSIIVDANAKSIKAMLSAFVLGKRNGELELAVWKHMPQKVAVEPDAVINRLYDEFGSDVKEAPDDNFENLSDINASAITNVTFDMWMQLPAKDIAVDDFRTSPFFVGGSAYLGDLWSFPFRLYLGAEFNKSDMRRFDVGYIAPINTLMDTRLLFDGMVSHEAVVGGYGTDVTGSGYLAYRMNLELGRAYVRFQFGRSVAGNYEETVGDYYTSVGFGYVLTASGGGVHK